MFNPYPMSGAKLKKCVKVLNIIGYFVADLCGLFGGFLAFVLLEALNVNGWIIAFGTIAAAGMVAAPFLFMVWFGGLVLWTISDAADDSKAVRDKLEG